MNPHQMSSLLFSWEFIESDPLKIKILQAATRKNHLYFKDALEEIDFEAVSLEIKIIICHLISELQIKSIPILKKLLNDSNLNVQMNAINSYSWSIDKSINKTLAEKLVASNIKIRNKVIQELKRKNLLNMYFKDYCQDKTPPIYKTS